MLASIREFGFKIPILIRSDGSVIDGHLRLKAAQQAGMEAVPAILCDEWSEAQVKAFRLLANRSVNWAEWDDELVALEIADLQGMGFDLSLTGFDAGEIELFQLAGQDGLTDEDAIPELPAKPVTRSGDLWILGEHRLLCGDATVSADVARVFGNLEPTLMVADPPYGVDYNPAWREKNWRGARSIGKVQADDRADWRQAWALFPGDIAYVWHAGNKAAVVAGSLEACGFEIRSQIIWAKQHFVISRGHYHLQHEPCWYAVRKGRTGHWTGDRQQTTLWPIANRNAFGGSTDDTSTGHGTQKPVECMRRPILNHTSLGQAVYDPFVGSGTTLIAAEATRRRCIAMDIDPAYVDVAVLRWQSYTGQAAVFDGSSQTFEEIRRQRHVEKAG
jgi:DNA modification methylase